MLEEYCDEEDFRFIQQCIDHESEEFMNYEAMSKSEVKRFINHKVMPIVKDAVIKRTIEAVNDGEIISKSFLEDTNFLIRECFSEAVDEFFYWNCKGDLLRDTKQSSLDNCKGDLLQDSKESSLDIWLDNLVLSLSTRGIPALEIVTHLQECHHVVVPVEEVNSIIMKSGYNDCKLASAM